MAIRLRRINNVLVAICAARSVPKEGDIYLDDEGHYALTIKFGLDFALAFYKDSEEARVMCQEESNNEARRLWDKLYDA